MYEQQEELEYSYSRKHVLSQIRKWLLEQPEIVEKIDSGVKLLSDSNIDLGNLDQYELVRDVLLHSSILFNEELFVSFTAQLANILGFSEKPDAIALMAEIVVLLAELDVYDIGKANKQASLTVKSRIVLPQDMVNAVHRSHYLPPMLVEPLPINNNYQSPYLTFNEVQILGKGNAHSNDICLDVINTQNAIPLVLCQELISTVEERQTKVPETMEQQKQWMVFKKQSQELYELIDDKEFYLTNKVDKRGRLYASGYHVNTMGNPFKKASVELARKECVTF